MKLYYSKGACSLAVRIIINELKLDCEFESVNLKEKITETGKNFFEISPKGAVPTLMLDNDEILTENTVIQQYLADHHKGEKLLPGIENFKRYRVLEWLNYMTTDVHKSYGPLFNPKVPNEMKQEIFLPNLEAKYDYVNKMLENHDYLLGNEFTLPDAYLFVTLRWLAAFNIDIKRWSNLESFFNRLMKRPSIELSMKEEGLK
jgi:glutathione S-transferase